MHTQVADNSPRTIQVWDPLVRVFHWTLVTGFAANLWVSEEGGQSHQVIGYVLLAAVVIRVAWGFVGTHHARFRDFVPGPVRLARYLGQVARGREPRHIGHNPAGAVMMLVLMMLMFLLGVSGWMMTLDRYWGEEWLEELHEGLANTMLALVAVHVFAALWAGVRHRENLVLAMLTGRKRPADVADVEHAPVVDRR